MKVSAAKAAEMTGKSIPTITRACNKGKLSHEREGSGYLIDVSELERVFPMKPSNANATPTKLDIETPNDMRVLQVEIEGLRERLADRSEEVSYLRGQLEKEAAERIKLHALLTDQRPAPPPADTVEPPKRRWWRFGRAND